MKFMKLGSKPDSFQSDRKNIRSVKTDLATDIVIHVGEIKFHLHKFPLLSKSSRLQKLVGNSNDENIDEIHIPDIPGGPAAFEVCAKFCYGMTATLNAYNVIAARCAAEYLEMHESVEKGNLIYKIEVFLNTSIFHGWKDSILVLQTMKSLAPWSEDLKLVSHCIDSLASKASVDISKVEWSYTYNRKKLPTENGIDSHWNGVRKEQLVPKDWWVEDLCELEMDIYKRVILAIKTKGRVSPNVIGEALKAYTYKALSNCSKGPTSLGGDATKNQSLLETIIWLLPAERGSVSCSFLLKLLRATSLLDCGETSRKELIKRIGRQLEDASVSDLVIPASAGENLMYDVDTILNVVEEFIMQYNNATQLNTHAAKGLKEIRNPTLASDSSKIAVAKLLDGYLAEVAKDPNLPLSKFIDLAEIISSNSRPVHDGLYRAIDMYLKEHPSLTKSERKRLCSLMDCKKLSSDACMHAVQNERLPLRLAVQVLFFEQMKASAATNNRAEGRGSYGSSRSGITTNTDDDWDGAPTIEDVKPSKPAKLSVAGGEREKSGRSNDASNGHDKVVNGKVKRIVIPKRMIGKLLSSKGHSMDNSSSSDTSGSPDSVKQEEPKSTPSRNTRYSIS